MDLLDLTDAARAYRDMGDAVSSQLDAILDRWDIEHLIETGDLNPNALSLMRPYLERAAGLGADDAYEALALIDAYEAERMEQRRDALEGRR